MVCIIRTEEHLLSSQTRLTVLTVAIPTRDDAGFPQILSTPAVRSQGFPASHVWQQIASTRYLGHSQVESIQCVMLEPVRREPFCPQHS